MITEFSKLSWMLSHGPERLGPSAPGNAGFGATDNRVDEVAVAPYGLWTRACRRRSRLDVGPPRIRSEHVVARCGWILGERPRASQALSRSKRSGFPTRSRGRKASRFTSKRSLDEARVAGERGSGSTARGTDSDAASRVSFTAPRAAVHRAPLRQGRRQPPRRAAAGQLTALTGPKTVRGGLRPPSASRSKSRGCATRGFDRAAENDEGAEQSGDGAFLGSSRWTPRT